MVLYERLLKVYNVNKNKFDIKDFKVVLSFFFSDKKGESGFYLVLKFRNNDNKFIRRGCTEKQIEHTAVCNWDTCKNYVVQEQTLTEFITNSLQKYKLQIVE